MDNPVFVAQNAQEHHYQAPVPRPDEFPEDPSTSLSYWIRDHKIDLDTIWASKPLPSDVDVVIIGSGISGAAALYELSLQQPQLRIAVLEARGICTGATGRNGGHIFRPECYMLNKTAKTWGAEEAIRLKQYGAKNRDMMLDCIQSLGVADKVDLRLNGTVVVFETADERDAFLEDMAFAQSNDYHPENVHLSPKETAKVSQLNAPFTTSRPHKLILAQRFDLDPSKCAFGAAFIQRSGTMHPRKFVHILLQKALDRIPYLSIHPHNPVLGITMTENGASPLYQVRTKKGYITARAVLHATNAYAGSICSDLHGTDGVFGCKAHMIAVQPNVKDCSKQLQVGFGYADFWHWLHQRPNNGPFLYGFGEAELLNDYDDTRTISEDHPARQRMNTFLGAVFPSWYENVDITKDATHDWTGVQGFTMTGASIVGQVSKNSPGEFASVGHNGEGMTRCFASAYIATRALLAYLDGERFQTPAWFPHSYRRNI
jgi:glycine/D-amino acid oxidase-like deaminating enzyme